MSISGRCRDAAIDRLRECMVSGKCTRGNAVTRSTVFARAGELIKSQFTHAKLAAKISVSCVST